MKWGAGKVAGGLQSRGLFHSMQEHPLKQQKGLTGKGLHQTIWRKTRGLQEQDFSENSDNRPHAF
jgi:hypothetical protein